MLSGSRPAAAAIDRTVSVTAIPSNSGSARTAGACPMKRPWVAAAKILVAPAQRRASADQIIEDDHRAIAHLADEELTGDDFAAAPFFDERRRRLVMQFRREGSAKLLGALGAADVGRDDGDFFMPHSRAKCSTKSGSASRLLDGQRKAFSKAATLWTSRVITASAPQASNSLATYLVVIGSRGCVRRSLRA